MGIHNLGVGTWRACGIKTEMKFHSGYHYFKMSYQGSDCIWYMKSKDHFKVEFRSQSVWFPGKRQWIYIQFRACVDASAIILAVDFFFYPDSTNCKQRQSYFSLVSLKVTFWQNVVLLILLLSRAMYCLSRVLLLYILCLVL